MVLRKSTFLPRESVKRPSSSICRSRSWAQIEKEIEGCILVCACCHRDIHSSWGRDWRKFDFVDSCFSATTSGIDLFDVNQGEELLDIMESCQRLSSANYIIFGGIWDLLLILVVSLLALWIISRIYLWVKFGN